MTKAEKNPLPNADSVLRQWSEATALALELMQAGIRAEEPTLTDAEVLERCRQRLAKSREGKYGLALRAEKIAR